MKHPLLYEINARQWMAALRAQYGPAMDLASIPENEFTRLSALGFTHLWLMGVWPTGSRSREQAVAHPDLRSAYEEALPGWREADIEGSPYAVEEWRVSKRLGGEKALAVFRRRLAEHGMGLILDFVPNHLGLDHCWLRESETRFVSYSKEFPFSFALENGGSRRFVAHGKDPYFAGWTDTIQLEYRREETRAAMVEQLRSVASQCDGVRCDMAMLLLSEVFNRTWAHVPFDGNQAAGEFWREAIDRVRQDRPDFLFLAEAYWDLEGTLCDLGFDYAYDKKLYDFLVHDHVAQVQPHLLGMGQQNARRAHFLENHDEPRVSGLLDSDRHRTALTLAMGLPGMRFLHDGQMEGRRRFARVQLNRWADEAPDPTIGSIYTEVLTAFSRSGVGEGVGRVLPAHRAWAENPTSEYFTVIEWGSGGNEAPRELVVVNLAPHRAQCRVWPDWVGLDCGRWLLRDRLGSEAWLRDGTEMRRHGLYLDLPPRGAQLFEVSFAGR